MMLPSYPFHMGVPRRPLFPSWPSTPFRLPTPRAPFLLTYPRMPPSSPFVHSQMKSILPQTIEPYSSSRYNRLKQSASYTSRRSAHRPIEASSVHSTMYTDSRSAPHRRVSKTRSISELQPSFSSTSAPLPKTQSWHSMASGRQSNLSVSYAEEMHLTSKHQRKRSPKRKPPTGKRSSFQRQPSRRSQRKRIVHLPERGVVRISTLDELPIANNQSSERNRSVNHDRLSSKGSVSNSSKSRTLSKERPAAKNPKKQRPAKTNDGGQGTNRSLSNSSISSSSSVSSTFQQRLNGSLRHDPLISAAMEDFRDHQRNSNLTPPETPTGRHLSRDRLDSNSTVQSPPSPPISRSGSHSSLTSVERSEIRQIIQTMRTKGAHVSTGPSQPATILSVAEPSRVQPTSAIPTTKPKKSSITEELDREFGKLRALVPEQELTYVTPSSIAKRKARTKRPAPILPPIPTFNELLQQVQLRPINKPTALASLRISPLSVTFPREENASVDAIKTPLAPIVVPQSSPIPPFEDKADEEKHDYATPVKRSEDKFRAQLCQFQPIGKTKPIAVALPNKVQPRPPSVFDWLQSGLTNSFPSTFQPNRVSNPSHGYAAASAKENIYTSDVDVHFPIPSLDKNEENSLAAHLENQTIMTDHYYSDHDCEQTTTATSTTSSIVNDVSRLLTRKHEHKLKSHRKHSRCSIM